MDQNYVYATAALIAASRLGDAPQAFDPFAPIWLFLAGYFQVYVVQALFYRDYALRVRGLDLVTAANFRALWALAWFLLVYHCGASRAVARGCPAPPSGGRSPWSRPSRRS